MLSILADIPERKGQPAIIMFCNERPKDSENSPSLQKPLYPALMPLQCRQGFRVLGVGEACRYYHHPVGGEEGTAQKAVRQELIGDPQLKEQLFEEEGLVSYHRDIKHRGSDLQATDKFFMVLIIPGSCPLGGAVLLFSIKFITI